MAAADRGRRRNGRARICAERRMAPASGGRRSGHAADGVFSEAGADGAASVRGAGAVGAACAPDVRLDARGAGAACVRGRLLDGRGCGFRAVHGAVPGAAGRRTVRSAEALPEQLPHRAVRIGDPAHRAVRLCLPAGSGQKRRRISAVPHRDRGV